LAILARSGRTGRTVGEKIALSEALGDHGIAVLSLVEGLELEAVLESASAPLSGLAQAILDASLKPDVCAPRRATASPPR
jgi:hydrogenase maturation factor